MARLSLPVATEGRVKVWDLESARELPAPPEQSMMIINQLAFTPDGKTLILTTEHRDDYTEPGEVTFWDAATAAPAA